MRPPFVTFSVAVAPGYLATVPARAVDLVAIGKVAATATDYSGQRGTLENGVRGDLLGGVGSGQGVAVRTHGSGSVVVCGATVRVGQPNERHPGDTWRLAADTVPVGSYRPSSLSPG